eukprot:scaffold4658_cov229-Ochromonas_danica.AAC.3
MAGVLVILGIFILSVYYIVLALSKGRKRDESCSDCVAAKSETLRRESSRSKTLRKKFSIPEKDGKVAISIDRDDDKHYSDLNELVSLLSESCVVYLIVQSSSEEEEESFEEVAKSRLPALPRHRLLHYEKALGKTAFLRQIVPHLHIEWEEEVARSLKPHLPCILLHTLAGNSSLAPRDLATVTALFDLISAE